MRRLFAAGGLIAAGACSTYGCGEQLSNTETDGGALDASPSTDAASGIDAASPADDAADVDGSDGSTPDAATCDLSPPPGLVYHAPLDVDCGGWKVENGTIELVADPRRCGAGACKVCISGAGESVLNREIIVERTNGTFELRFQVRGDTLIGDLNAGAYPFDDAGNQLGSGQNVIPLVQGTWSLGQVISTNTATTVKVLVRIVTPLSSNGLCYFIDEIRLGHY